MKIFEIQTIGWKKLCAADEREEIRVKLVSLGHNWFQINEIQVLNIKDLPVCKDSEM